LALENFDNMGRWRDVDVGARGAPIDSTTVLSSGLKLDGPVELRNYILSLDDQFPSTVASNLMMYALNREVEYYDRPVLRQIVREAKASNYSFGALLKGVVNSAAFRHQGPEKQTQTMASTLPGGTAAATQR
jgi:hypothetical protein